MGGKMLGVETSRDNMWRGKASGESVLHPSDFSFARSQKWNCFFLF